MRDVDPALIAEIDSGHWRPIVGVELDWPETGWARFHNRVGDAVLDGERFRGVGDLGAINDLSESQGLAVREISLTLTGFLSDQLAMLRAGRVRNRAAQISIGAVDAKGQQIGAMLSLIRGKMRALSFHVRDANALEFKHQIEVRVFNFFTSIRRIIEVRLEHPRLAALRDEPPLWPE